jgi:hypothetical protein
MSSVPPITPTELDDLASKYESLVRLRASRDHDPNGGSQTNTVNGSNGVNTVNGSNGDNGQSVRDLLRELSRKFPGSLRELDTLGLLELQRRARVARAAAAGGAREPWMEWILAFHRLTAAALLIKRDDAARRRGRPVNEGASRQQAAAVARFTLDPPLVAELTRPPGGRLAPVVLRELARRFAVEPRALSETLFPSRRRRAETLH